VRNTIDMHARTEMGSSVGEASTFIIQSADGVGAAFLVDDQLGLTAAHVLGDSEFVRVLNPREDGALLVARVVAREESDDLAVLYFQRAPDASPLPLADNVEIGQSVVAVGAPGGELTSTRGAVTDISDDFIRADALVAQGNSGGPLVNSEGEVVGLVTQLEASTNFAIARPPQELSALLARTPVQESFNEVGVESSDYTFPVAIIWLSLFLFSVTLAFVARMAIVRNRKRRLIRIEIN